VYFSSGGSDAVDSALKLARQYWKIRGQQDRSKFIALRQVPRRALRRHERERQHHFRRAYEPLLPGCFHVDTPWLYRNPYTGDPCARRALQPSCWSARSCSEPGHGRGLHRRAGAGAGGVIVPPPNYWPLVRKVCDKYGVLLIADEVVTGFGRTGHLFGTRLWGVQADIWCLAKGISSGYVPLGATALSGKVARVFQEADSAAGAVAHGHTYSAHPVAAAAALATLDILEREDVVANVARRSLPIERLRRWRRAPADRRRARHRPHGLPRAGRRPRHEGDAAARREAGDAAGARGLPARRDDPHLRPEHHPVAGADHQP
jgi:adenosylmethionine-8-amino-7-oxononanoate aminotransferase